MFTVVVRITKIRIVHTLIFPSSLLSTIMMYLAFETQPCDISAVTGKTPLPLVGGIPFPENLNRD